MAVVIRPSEEKRPYIEDILKKLRNEYGIRCGVASQNLKIFIRGYCFSISRGDYIIPFPKDSFQKELVDNIAVKLKKEGINTYVIDITTLTFLYLMENGK
jgi:hypothetical protein